MNSVLIQKIPQYQQHNEQKFAGISFLIDFVTHIGLFKLTTPAYIYTCIMPFSNLNPSKESVSGLFLGILRYEAK